MSGARRALLLLLACCVIYTSTLASQTLPPLGAADRARLAEVLRLASAVRARIWPGWEHTTLAILLVRDSAEYLIGHPRPSSDFIRAGFDSLLGLDVWSRPRVFAPTLLATFPAVGGLPTIVAGSAEHTGKSSTDWVLTLLHEHFHQWQYSLPDYYSRVARLDLAGGDSTGMWMLNYPFPYDSAPVERAAKRLAAALSEALDAAPAARPRMVSAAIQHQNALTAELTPAENRYLEFQLWQEGVARSIEYRAAQLATSVGEPVPQFSGLPDYQTYESVAARNIRSLRHELRSLELRQHRRTSFYPIGAAMALLLEESRPDWKREYEAAPFGVSPLLSASR